MSREPKKPEKPKVGLRKSFLDLHNIPAGPERTRQIIRASVIRGTRQWKAVTVAIDHLKEKGVLSENDSNRAKLSLFNSWSEKISSRAPLTYLVDLASNKQAPIKGISDGLSVAFDHLVVLKNKEVIRFFAVDKKKDIQIFLEPNTGKVRIVEREL